MNKQANGGNRQTALVTGASGGIGLELARRFARGGYDTVLVARSADKLAELATAIGAEFGIEATPVASDLSQPGAVNALVAEISSRNIEINVLVNNAGYGMAGSFDRTNLADQLGMIDLNVRALTELTHAFWPEILRGKRGGLLNVASLAAFMPSPNMAIYAATKAYVKSFTEALWEEARGTGVHVSCLCPGSTISHFHDRAGTKQMPAGKAKAMSAAEVAQIGYEAFRANKRVGMPGAANRMIAAVMPLLPAGPMLKTAKKMFEF